MTIILGGLLPVTVRAADTADSATPAFTFTSKPRWEFGVGAAYVNGHDYPASRDRNRATIGLPYVMYRSRVLRLGEEGVGAVAVERPRLRLDLSLGVSLSASSTGNRARESMPDLAYLLEFGPRLNLRLYDRYRDTYGRTRLDWNAKVRAVVAADTDGLEPTGWVLASGFRLTQRDLFNRPLDVLANLDATFASEQLQDYYYEVAPRFETPQRPAYNARAGYLGTRLFLALVYRPIPALRLIAGVNFGQYSGAANRDSPLYETPDSTSLAFGFVWRLLQSRRRIDVMDTD